MDIKVLLSSPDFKVLKLSGEAGSTLKKHKVNKPALLLMQSGNLIYSEQSRQQELSAGECLNIPSEVFHEVKCLDTTNFFLVITNDTKMKFQHEV